MDERELREIASSIMQIVGDLLALHGIFEAIRANARNNCLYDGALGVLHYSNELERRIGAIAKKLAELAGKLNKAASEH